MANTISTFHYSFTKIDVYNPDGFGFRLTHMSERGIDTLEYVGIEFL